MDFAGLHHRWIAVCVRRRQESVAARILSEHAYETALPQLPRCGKCDRRCNGGPLFPGYFFCRFDSSNPWRILGTTGVKGIVSYGRKIVPVNSDDVANAMAVSSSSRCRYVVDLAGSGSLVQIVAGPLAGVRGRYVRSGKHGRILISVEILRRSITVQLNEDARRAEAAVGLVTADGCILLPTGFEVSSSTKCNVKFGGPANYPNWSRTGQVFSKNPSNGLPVLDQCDWQMGACEVGTIQARGGCCDTLECSCTNRITL